MTIAAPQHPDRQQIVGLDINPFSCRWRRSPGDVALWDERVTLHSIVDDIGTGDDARILHRVTVLGDDPQPPADVPVWERHRSDKTAASGFYGMAGFEF